MRLASISTSGPVGSVALSSGGHVMAARDFAAGLLHGQALLPALAALFRACRWDPQDVDGLAVDIGPGSYTGCRVGVMAAKTLAHQTGAQLVGVPSVAAIALRVSREAGPKGIGQTIACLLDARRGFGYVALYRQAESGVEELLPPAIALVSAWVKTVKADVWAGDALDRYPGTLQEVRRASEACWTPDASHVALLGHGRLSRGESDDVHRLVPLYLRAPEAEERYGKGGPEKGSA